ncbi:MAG TPA: hypothetical protein VEU73_05180 [Gemmatimonadales bacterium]|nr:hypothetical protein [Gemmatimonadales bacterium]
MSNPIKPGRRFDDQEVSRILERAAELQHRIRRIRSAGFASRSRRAPATP